MRRTTGASFSQYFPIETCSIARRASKIAHMELWTILVHVERCLLGTLRETNIERRGGELRGRSPHPEDYAPVTHALSNERLNRFCASGWRSADTAAPPSFSRERTARETPRVFAQHMPEVQQLQIVRQTIYKGLNTRVRTHRVRLCGLRTQFILSTDRHTRRRPQSKMPQASVI